jgi:hypothetical protein
VITTLQVQGMYLLWQEHLPSCLCRQGWWISMRWLCSLMLLLVFRILASKVL